VIRKAEGALLVPAARIHAASWQASHRAICTPDFVAAHTPEHQRRYIEGKIREGSAFYLLCAPHPVGLVSVREGLIEDLYVLPEEQNRGYGTQLLRYAVGKCGGRAALWVLSSNTGARRLYLRLGFRPTMRRRPLSQQLYEEELVWE
jgi:GNAT superfamily N-acetyltransferase